jgi:aryl-phospho-beta-D-glucosidase BglC (GH1 family)
METEVCYIGGADKRDIASSAKWLADNGFNAIRLPLAADAILHPTGHPCMLLGDQDGLRLHNMALGAMKYVEQIAEVVRVAADSGLLVLLDMHVINAGMWPDGGAVGTSDRSSLRDAWRKLATELCDAEQYWNVIGADLKYGHGVDEPGALFPLRNSYEPVHIWVRFHGLPDPAQERALFDVLG